MKARVQRVTRTLGRLRPRRRGHVGAPPGVLSVDPEAPATILTVLTFGPTELEERVLTSLDELDELEKRDVLWLNIDGLGSLELLTAVQERFGLHQLAMEDVVNVHQRAKVEAYPNQVFLVARAHYPGDVRPSEQISFFIGDDYILTFQEFPGDCFQPVRERLRHGRGRIRQLGADYLAYALLDAIVDGYFPVLEELGDQLEQLEVVAFSERGGGRRNISSEINDVRWRLLGIRRTIWPLRDAVRALQVEDAVQLSGEVQVFLRDCADHVLQALDHVETYQHMAGALMDGYLSLASHRMNEVMKVLTMIATIFIPLSFVVGLYGMNFDTMASPFNLPELSWRFGYPAVWVLMLTIATFMLFFFKRRGWFQR